MHQWDKNGQILRPPLIKGAEALADDLAGVDDGDKAPGIVLAQEIAQLQCLTAGQHRDQNAELVVGVGTVGLFHGSRAVQFLDDEVQNGLRVGRHDGAHLAQADVLDGTIHHKALADQAEDTVQAGAHAKPPCRRQHDEDIADHQGLSDLHRGIFCQDQGHNIRTAGGCANVEHDGRTKRRQEHCEHQIQHGVTAHGNVDGIEPLAHRHEKGQCEGRIDRPAHGLDAQKDEAQHHQNQVDDPHKAAHVDLREQVCQQNGQARGAAKCKMVGIFKVYDADRSQDQAKVQLTKEI